MPLSPTASEASSSRPTALLSPASDLVEAEQAKMAPLLIPEPSIASTSDAQGQRNILTRGLSKLSRVISRQSVISRKPIRKRDFGFLPIPKNRRHDPNLKPEEQFKFSLRMNIVFAVAAVSDFFIGIRGSD